MAANQSTALLDSGFQQHLDNWFTSVIELVDNRLARACECHDAACPILGSHNTDECAELIAQAKQEGTL